jgi:porphobilinogen synthase
MIKQHFPACMVFPDVALDPYTSHGHDGLIDEKGQILNDESISILAQQSVLFAEHGADMLAPSDQFDGRTLAIRSALDQAHFPYVGIISYSAKYASAYYSPFRSALGNDHLQNIDKSTYQLDPANTRQALAKIEIEMQEGADILMIKPAGHYLDIVSAARALINKPIAVFHVSGECAVLKLAAEQGLFDEIRALQEQILSMRRAGADLIFTYYAEKIAQLTN